MKKQAVEIIMFVLAGCGFCVKAQKILESEIKEGKVEVKPHTEAKGLKWARGFPCLVRLKDGKGVLGCPNSFDDLMQKLDKSEIVVEKMELSKFNKIKLPPKVKAVQRKNIVPMKNKVVEPVVHNTKLHDHKDQLKPILKKKDKALPSKPKHSKETFKKAVRLNADPLNKIMFYHMATCPYCKQGEIMLDEYIRKGDIIVLPHTQAPKDVGSFPYFSYNDKKEYGLPKSAESLFEKLGYKFENFVIRQEEKTVKIAQEENETTSEEPKEFYTSYGNMKFMSYTKPPPKHPELPKNSSMLGVL
jgi:glutaredoxin